MFIASDTRIPSLLGNKVRTKTDLLKSGFQLAPFGFFQRGALRSSLGLLFRRLRLRRNAD